jgi:hypothetical protein
MMLSESLKHTSTGTPKEFLGAVAEHLMKSIDYVVIDLKGASKGQIEIIKKFIANQSGTLQRKVIWVQ